ncbi:hypothetical protein AQUCO_00900970v1 [Aquilegia coerulea]|uniref:Peptidase S59 domain-containing protein n=1 Tax=Aquilegia coerulea TaxID=218851 RepID=A0A2G5EG83_AQUCA|nr:hypothetical protein AQUCO_00900970v1 [Aquilegia coerulea]
MFGSTSSFGQSSSSPSGSQSVFVQNNNPFTPKPFGSSFPFRSSSTPTFGASSSPAFGSSVPPFGASSKPAFGSGSSSFGGSSVFGQKPAFGGFGSTPSQTQTSPFGGTFQQTQSAFGSYQFGSSTTFGASSTPASSSSSTPPFGSASTPTFGSTSASTFGSTGSTFGVSNAPAFGSGAFGTSSAPTFGSSKTFAFGVYSTSALGSSSTPALGVSSATKASSSPSFGFETSPSFGQSNSTFGSRSQVPTPALVGSGFGQPAFGDQRGGSRVTNYIPTPVVDGGSVTQPAGKLMSISAMSVYRDKSLEELRWEDYHLGDKDGSSTAVQPAAQPSPLGVSTTFGHSSTNVFPSTTSSNPFPLNPSPIGTSPAFVVSSSPPIFGSNPAPGLAFGQTSSGPLTTQSVGVLQSNPPSLGQTNSAFGQTGSAFRQSTSSSGQPNPFNTSSTSGGNVYSSSATPSILPTSNQTAKLASTSSALPLGNIRASDVVTQPTPVSNPFGILPAVPQMSIGLSGSSPAVQYGISSMPVTDKPAPVRVSSLLTSRHLYQRRSNLPARKYHPRNDAPKVPFYYDDEEAPNSRKENALLIPRENPRALVICSSVENPSPLKKTHDSVHRDDGVAEIGSDKEHISNQRANGEQENHSSRKMDSYITLTGHRAGEASVVCEHGAGAGEAAVVCEHGAEIEALMPNLKHADYYTEPWIQELAAKERVEPGFCQHVKNFVVGRHGYGRIKFIGETDVRGLDLESLVQFNYREVIVYMDDSKKPPVGQGLNKPAEVTLLNIKCFDKKTGQQYTEGPKLEKYKEMLTKKAQEQEAEFVSYDPLKGEWTFSVKHF